jgi:hypothetical protein
MGMNELIPSCPMHASHFAVQGASWSNIIFHMAIALSGGFDLDP